MSPGKWLCLQWALPAPCPQRSCSASGGDAGCKLALNPLCHICSLWGVHHVCWDTCYSLPYTSNCLSMTVNTQINQHLLQEASWAGCGWTLAFSSWKIQTTVCHTIILGWMSPLGKKKYCFWILAGFPVIFQHLKNLLVIRGCIKHDFTYKALQSLSKKYRKYSCFWTVILHFLVKNELLLSLHC